ncbi:TRAP transporter large permease [Chloroflexota bacterium]
MSPDIIGIIGIVVMLFLMFLRMPIGIVMMLVGFIGFCCISGLEQGFHILSTTAHAMASTYVLTVLPLFILMGMLAGISGLSKDAYYAINKWLGHLPGGLAMATVGACVGFAAVCGDAVASATTMTTVALPEMRRYNYADQLSLGAIACGGPLGFMIPPSVAFIIFAFLTEESIGDLFMAGIFPGLLIAILYILAIYITCIRNKSLGPRGPRATWKERFSALYLVWGILVLFLLVMGGMYSGVFTPTEAGAVGAFGALILGLIRKGITWKSFTESLYNTLHLTGMIFLLIIGAMVFNYFMAVSELPFTLANFVGTLPVQPIVILALILVVYVILGFFMNVIAIVVLTIPIFYPLILSLQIEPVWFAVLVVLTIMIGLVTPPVGMVVFAVAAYVKDVSLFTIFKGVWPFFYAMLVALIILIAFPQISLWLPSMMKPG